ncbi:class I SAM-dependent methyltransferase [Candidatus Micrarchaeota archaeon]|nr:class I SAM-dependent methyltransferase [Candidatus Micrarchaeota archaeon]
MEAYEKIAKDWDERRKAPFSSLALFLPSISKSEIILDAGCGNGRNLKLIAKCAKFACGIDSSKKMLHFAKKNLIGTKNASVSIGDISKMKFVANKFDKIFSSAVLHHLKPNLHQIAVFEMFRVLKKGGTIFLTVWVGKKGFKKEEMVKWALPSGEKALRYYYFFNSSELNALFKNAGFSKISIFYESSGKKTLKKQAKNICVIAHKAP